MHAVRSDGDYDATSSFVAGLFSIYTSHMIELRWHFVIDCTSERDVHYNSKGKRENDCMSVGIRRDIRQ